MLEQRKTLIDDRRKAAAQTKKQKEAIARVMEEVRTNASKAQKLITQVSSSLFFTLHLFLFCFLLRRSIFSSSFFFISLDAMSICFF